MSIQALYMKKSKNFVDNLRRAEVFGPNGGEYEENLTLAVEEQFFQMVIRCYLEIDIIR